MIDNTENEKETETLILSKQLISEIRQIKNIDNDLISSIYDIEGEITFENIIKYLIDKYYLRIERKYCKNKHCENHNIILQIHEDKDDMTYDCEKCGNQLDYKKSD